LLLGLLLQRLLRDLLLLLHWWWWLWQQGTQVLAGRVLGSGQDVPPWCYRLLLLLPQELLLHELLLQHLQGQGIYRQRRLLQQLLLLWLRSCCGRSSSL
jgi:hypothetical protein